MGLSMAAANSTYASSPPHIMTENLSENDEARASPFLFSDALFFSIDSVANTEVAAIEQYYPIWKARRRKFLEAEELGVEGGAAAPPHALLHGLYGRAVGDGFLVVLSSVISFVISLVRSLSSWDRPGCRAKRSLKRAFRAGLVRAPDGNWSKCTPPQSI